MERASHRSVGIRLGLLLLLGAARSRLFVAVAILPVACFTGAERDKEAPPGNVGGLCLAPDGHCKEGECNRSENYCFDRADPCRGFFCGGADRGLCQVTTDLQPSCLCAAGYNNDDYALYCCPDQALADPNCAPVGPMDDDDGGDESSGDESSGNASDETVG